MQHSLAGTIDDAGYQAIQVTCMSAGSERTANEVILAGGGLGRRPGGSAPRRRGSHRRADVALVLAVDVSGSVDDRRFKLQREGIAEALESDDSSPASPAHQPDDRDRRRRMGGGADHRRALDDRSRPGGSPRRRPSLRETGRSWLHVRTDPNGGIIAADHSSRRCRCRHFASHRRLGDGRQNSGEVATAVARDDAIAHGIIINGLPITSGAEPDVDAWYRDNVIGGPALS